MWIKDIPPTQAGYYLTSYTKDNETQFKPFWYSIKKHQWQYELFDPEVKYFWDVRFDFYFPCLIQPGVTEIPQEIVEEKALEQL